MPDLALLRARLLSAHHLHMQNARRVELALAAIRDGIATLVALGHQFHLAEGPLAAGDEMLTWPRVYYHSASAPNGRLVLSPWDLAELGPDWWPTANEAAHSDGMATQFAGRGGVGRRDLPVVVPDPAEPNTRHESPAEARLRLIAEFQQNRNRENET